MNEDIGEQARSVLVSVIVPAFNASATLARTLASALAQTHETLEIVVVDDGSTDDTLAIAHRFRDADPRVRVVHKANGGTASAWNRGIAETDGRWIAPLDADDLWHPSKIDKQLSVALAAPRAPGFVYCFSRWIDAEDRVFGDLPGLACDGRVLDRHVWRNFIGNGSTCLFSRAAVEAAGGFDESSRAQAADGSEDLMLQLRVARDREAVCVPEYLVGYRTGGRTGSDPDRMARSWALVVARLRATATEVAPEAIRWASAERGLRHAEALAWRGGWARSARLVLTALAADPKGIGTMLAWRVSRALRRRLRRTPPHAPLRPFHELDPALPSPSQAEAAGAAWNALQRLDQARGARLEALDAARVVE